MIRTSWRIRYNLERFAAKIDPELSARAGGLNVSVRQMQNVVETGHNLHDFLSAVEVGVDPDDLLELVNNRPITMSSAHALKGEDGKISFPEYMKIRDRGVTHHQIRSLVCGDPDSPEHGHGATLENINRALDSGAKISEYSDWLDRLGNYGVVQSQHDGYFLGRNYGYSHKDLVDLLNQSGHNTNFEQFIRSMGRKQNTKTETPTTTSPVENKVTEIDPVEQEHVRTVAHENALDPQSLSSEYTKLRSENDHSTALNKAIARVIRANNYTTALTNGAEADEVIEAEREGLLSLYAPLRKDLDHKSALAKAKELKKIQD